jgi:predicted dienelactone hydrolase
MGSWRPNAAIENAPIAAGGPWPLVIYSHGTFGRPDNAMHLVNELVSHGYVVAAPAYPLSSSAAFTKVRFADVSDVGNQTRDVSFIIDSLLTDKFLAPAIDKARIGATGISLGAVTSYFATFGVQTRDPRIVATALIGGSDPVQAALSTDLGLAGTAHSWKPVPVLFLSAEKDVFAWIMGRPYAAYSRVPDPRLEVMIKGGVHVWFGDGADRPEDGKNPDCLFFEKYSPQMVPPICSDRAPLIDPARQKEISRIALRGFFDAFLKDDEAGLARLRGLEKQFSEVALRVKD